MDSSPFYFFPLAFLSISLYGFVEKSLGLRYLAKIEKTSRTIIKNTGAKSTRFKK